MRLAAPLEVKELLYVEQGLGMVRVLLDVEALGLLTGEQQEDGLGQGELFEVGRERLMPVPVTEEGTIESGRKRDLPRFFLLGVPEALGSLWAVRIWSIRASAFMQIL